MNQHWYINNTVMLEKTLESPLDCKEIKQVNPKGNQSSTFIGRTDAEAPIFWPLDVKNRLIEKDPDDGKDWRQEEKGITEDKMVVWHHQLNGHELSKLQEVMKDREPGVLQSMALQRVGYDWVTQQQLRFLFSNIYPVEKTFLSLMELGHLLKIVCVWILVSVALIYLSIPEVILLLRFVFPWLTIFPSCLIS